MPGENEPSGFILTTILGVVGAFVATFLGQALGWYRAGEGAAQGKVALVEALGGDTLLYADVGNVRLVSRQNERTPLHAGDAVGLDFDARALHYFDSQGRVVKAA